MNRKRIINAGELLTGREGITVPVPRTRMPHVMFSQYVFCGEAGVRESREFVLVLDFYLSEDGIEDFNVNSYMRKAGVSLFD